MTLSGATYDMAVTARTRDIIEYLAAAGYPKLAVAVDKEFAIRDGIIPPSREWRAE